MSELGREPLTQQTLLHSEKYICKLYGIEDIGSVDEAIAKPFRKCQVQEKLPPTHDALHLQNQTMSLSNQHMVKRW